MRGVLRLTEVLERSGIPIADRQYVATRLVPDGRLDPGSEEFVEVLLWIEPPSDRSLRDAVRTVTSVVEQAKRLIGNPTRIEVSAT